MKTNVLQCPVIDEILIMIPIAMLGLTWYDIWPVDVGIGLKLQIVHHLLPRLVAGAAHRSPQLLLLSLEWAFSADNQGRCHTGSRGQLCNITKLYSVADTLLSLFNPKYQY